MIPALRRIAPLPTGRFKVVLGEQGSFRKGRAMRSRLIHANPETCAHSFDKSEWDLVIGVAGATVSNLTDTGPNFVQADAMYIAAPGRELAHVSTIERAGFKGVHVAPP